MKKNYFLPYLVLFSVGCLLTGMPLVAQAMEGGQVGQQGVIEFYEDNSTTEPSDNSTTEPTVEPSAEPSTSTPSSLSTEPVQKPAGNYPSTGEVVQRSLMLSGVALLFIALLFAVWKKRKEKEES